MSTDTPGAQAREYLTDIAFTDSVKATQTRYGTRAQGERLEQSGRWTSEITDDIAAFIAERDSFYFGTASAAGRPYIQHRGGPAGFLKVLDPGTLAFADYPGNKQYITAGNLMENPNAFIFLMDYANRRRIKFWGQGAVIDGDPELLQKLHDPAVPRAPERAIKFTIEAWDVNCPQFITPRFTADQVSQVVAEMQAKIEALEAEIARRDAGD